MDKVPANSPLFFSIEVVKIEQTKTMELPKKTKTKIEEKTDSDETKKKEEAPKEPEKDTPKFSVTVTQEGEGYKL